MFTARLMLAKAIAGLVRLILPPGTFLNISKELPPDLAETRRREYHAIYTALRRKD